MLESGVILMIDYGFSQREYYHPQRSEGTLMCHYRHFAHGDPFLYPGLQDITAHVDFTAMAEVGLEQGMQLLGYCGQAQFLINCGITDILARVSPHDIKRYAPLASQAQKLLSPAEMGELFKVIALGKGMTEDMVGFSRGDRRHTL
jgi:SAM-dependent MidA family methyltransferase